MIALRLVLGENKIDDEKILIAKQEVKEELELVKNKVLAFA